MSGMKKLLCAAAGAWVLCAAGSWFSATSVWTGVQPALAQAAGAPGRGQQARPQNPQGRQQRILEYLRQPDLTPQERAHELDLIRQNEEQEWGNFLSFFKEVSPNRYRSMQLRPPLPGAPVRLSLMQRWLNLQQYKQTEPELYGMHVEQFRVEDEIFGLAAQLRVATRRGNSSQANIVRAQIKVQADKLVDLNLSERAAQIEYARKQLDQQEATLNDDKANIAKLYQQREGSILQESQVGGLLQNPAPNANRGANVDPATSSPP
ncbi:MAG: hypothetical protein ABSH22_07965, partial [Tepidisphaeraceae bacterium]